MAEDARINLPPGTGDRIARRSVITSYARVLAEPNANAPQRTELVFGQCFNVYSETDGYVFGQACPLVPCSDRKGYVGWVQARTLGALTSEATHVVNALSAPVFRESDLKTTILKSLPLGSRLHVSEAVGDYLRISPDGYVHRLHVRSVSDPEGDFVDVARRYLGQPYVWGGNGARGIDCSGLVQMSLSLCGIDAPRDSDQQEAALGEPVSKAERRGDLLFWPGHVGIMASETQLLHANATHMGVVEEPLDEALKRMESAGTILRSVKRL